MKPLKKQMLGLFIYGLGLGLCATAHAEAPVGDFIVRGKNAGDSREYKGQVSVIKSGDTYTVMWRFGGTTYIGTGVEMNNSFAVAFKPSETLQVGLLLLQKKDKVWQGKWTQMGAKTVGVETWIGYQKQP